MKTAIVMLTFAFGASLPLQGAILQGALASDDSRTTSLTTGSQSQDLSAAKKKRKQVYVQTDGRYVRGADGYYYPRAFSPGDPSWQSPNMIQRRAAGECIIDLGYGRSESCDNAGRGGRR